MVPTISNDPQVIVSPTADALAERVAEDTLQAMQETLAAAPRFYWVLAGGSTPEKLYRRLAASPYKEKIPWSQLRVFFGDERCVPPEHVDSTFRMAKEALLD